MDNASSTPVERCNSAPPPPSSSTVNQSTAQQQQQLLEIEQQSAKLIKPQSVRLRRHSSLTRGLLHTVRKISESDERHGEAKVNNSINLSSSTEKLNMSSNSTPPSPSLLSSPSNMFRPIKNSPNNWEYQPSPEKDGYGLRPRNSTGKQCTRPSSRKRSSRLSGEAMAIDKPIKRLRLESHPTPNNTAPVSSDERTISSDSGIFINKSSTSTTEPTCTTHPVSSHANSSDVEFHWWHKTHRTRRLSTESIVSTDSITREINKPL